MGKRDVVVCDVVKEVDLLLLQQKSGSNGVDGCVSPSLIEETTIHVEGLEKVDVCLGSEPFKVTNLEVGPLDTC